MPATPVVNAGGSVTTDGSEQTLATIASPRLLQLMIDCNAMAAGDIIEIRVYGKARSSDSERLMDVWPIAHAQATPLRYTIPVMSPHHYRVTITRVAGTDRAYPWAVYEAA